MITDASEEEQTDLKAELGLRLLDSNNPEMITYLYNKEPRIFANIINLLDEENLHRKKYNIPPNFYVKTIRMNLVLRTSIKGWRAEQIEKILTKIDTESESTNVVSRLGKFMGQ